MALPKKYNIDEWGVRYSSDWKTLIGADHTTFQCEHYRIREGVTHIEANAFYHCQSLKSLWMPDSVTEEEGCLCEYCKNLEKARISVNIKYPDIAMFNSCTSLKEIELHEGLECIGENMFSGCSSLQHIKIPSSVKYFMGDTFCYTAIEEIELPEKLEKIGHDTFFGCDSLKRLVIPAKVTKIGSWLVQAHEDFEGLTCLSPHFRIESDSLISNNNNELIACWARDKVYHIPASVKIIGSICNDMIETIIVDSPLKRIDRDAFVGCKNLKRIIYHAPVKHADISYQCEHIEGAPTKQW